MQRKGALVEWLSDSLWASVSPRRNGGGATAPSSCSPPSSPSQTESVISRQSLLCVQLSKEVVDLDELRKLASEGIPDVAGIRSTVWKLHKQRKVVYTRFKSKLNFSYCAVDDNNIIRLLLITIAQCRDNSVCNLELNCKIEEAVAKGIILYRKLLLGYLPMDRHSWREELEKRRKQYMAFKTEFLLENTSEVSRRVEKESKNMGEILINNINEPLERSNIAPGEHPLSQRQSSIRNQFFQDSEMIEQIDRDVKRTHPNMNFFCGDSSLAMSNQDSLRNVLIIFAKLNSGLRYVQGMNEILAPLLYVFRSDPDVTNAAWAEADSFFCFVELLSRFRDHFCQKLDNSAVGIISTLNKLSQLLKLHDPEVWHHLEVKTEVNPQFYAFRWITLLLTHEFNLADTLHIWDVLLSDPQGPQETLLRVCCAMVILARKRILSGDFTSNVKLLQNYPPTNVSHLLYVANKLRV